MIDITKLKFQPIEFVDNACESTVILPGDDKVRIGEAMAVAILSLVIPIAINTTGLRAGAAGQRVVIKSGTMNPKRWEFDYRKMPTEEHFGRNEDRYGHRSPVATSVIIWRHFADQILSFVRDDVVRHHIIDEVDSLLISSIDRSECDGNWTEPTSLYLMVGCLDIYPYRQGMQMAVQIMQQFLILCIQSAITKHAGQVTLAGSDIARAILTPAISGTSDVATEVA